MPTGRHHTPNFAEKGFANSRKNLEIHERFLLRKFPTTRYCTVYFSTRNYPIKFFVDDLTEEGLMKLWRGRKDAPRLQSDQSAASDEYMIQSQLTNQITQRNSHHRSRQLTNQNHPQSHMTKLTPWRDFKIICQCSSSVQRCKLSGCHQAAYSCYR